MNESSNYQALSLFITIGIAFLLNIGLPITIDAFKSWKLDQQRKILDAQELLKSYLKDLPGVEAITILDNELYVFVAVKNSIHEETLKFIPTKINDFKVIVVQERFDG